VDSLVPVILNAVVVVLLCAAIFYGMRLHRRLTALQSAHAELAGLLGRLDGALAQASSTVSALKHNAAQQLETMAPRPPAAAERPAEAARKPAPVETIKTAPTRVEVAKPAATAARRRKPSASLIAGGRNAAADELMAVMKSMRSAG
jgi:hypothetical protein